MSLQLSDFHCVKIGDCTLYRADCLQVMPLLGEFDAVVTDPPYGVLKEEWDDLTDRELFAFTMRWVSLAYLRSDILLTFFGQKTRDVPNLLLPKIYESVRQIIWNKKGGAQASDNVFYSYESAYLCKKAIKKIEIVSGKSLSFARELSASRKRASFSKGAIDILVKGKKTGLCYRWEEGSCLPSDEQIEIMSSVISFSDKFYELLKKARAERDRNISANKQRTRNSAAHFLDVISYSPDIQNNHPSPKPVDLMKDIISILNRNAILDPFMGSGTTGVACVKLGRKFTGIELDPDYFEIACERIRKAYEQPDFFVEAPSKPIEPEQQDMLK